MNKAKWEKKCQITVGANILYYIQYIIIIIITFVGLYISSDIDCLCFEHIIIGELTVTHSSQVRLRELVRYLAHPRLIEILVTSLLATSTLTSTCFSIGHCCILHGFEPRSDSLVEQPGWLPMTLKDLQMFIDDNPGCSFV